MRSALPGGELVARGLLDLERGELSVEALLLAAASRRLGDLGLPIPGRLSLPRAPELALYTLLGETVDDPYAAYGALRRELDSFLTAFERRR